MYVTITIAGDPTSWWTEAVADASAFAAELAQGPVNVPVFYPVAGNLLISKGASVAIFAVPPTVSWIPSDAQAPVATLYVQAAPTGDDSGYELPVGTDIVNLAEQIKDSMTHGTTITIPVSSGLSRGVAVLNGASLTFAVVCPPPTP
jgi:hypothetical protein